MSLSTFCLLISADDAQKYDNGDEGFFLRALVQAQFARGTTWPNPAVGAVVVKDGRVLDEGFTEPPGGRHAEIRALSRSGDFAAGATLYVTLEPCSHFGRTAPCTDYIIDAGVKRVVYGVIDNNPRVCGGGIAALMKANIQTEEVVSDRLRAMADAIHLPFKKWVTKKRPYVVAKIATSADGFFSRAQGVQTKITGPAADELVHAMRRASDAVLVGGNTARIDNPQLSARLGFVGHGGQPTSIIVTATGNIPTDLAMTKREGARTIVITTRDAPMDRKSSDVTVIEVDGDKTQGIDLDQAFAKLGDLGFTLVLVEAGPRLFKELVMKKLVDEIFHLRSREVFRGEGPGIHNLKEHLSSSYKLCHEVYLGSDDLFVFMAN